MYSIVLEDHESKDLFIAEVNGGEDVDKIKKVGDELNNEYREETNKRDDFYVELCNRTGLNIYRADILSI